MSVEGLDEDEINAEETFARARLAAIEASAGGSFDNVMRWEILQCGAGAVAVEDWVGLGYARWQLLRSLRRLVAR